MGAFTAKERRRYRFRKHLKEKAFEFVLKFIKNIILTELVVWLVGSDRFLTGLIAALGYSAGWLVCELIWYRRDWLNVDIKDGDDPEE